MGARGVGHIDYLTRIAPPQVAVVLNVGSAHVGEFGSRANIAVAKAELPRAVPAEGLAVLNADDPLVVGMREGLACRVQLVGLSPEADVRAVDVALDERGRAAYTLVTPAGRARVALRQSGAHHVGNSLAVAAVALELGLSLDQVVAGLGAADAVSRWRMELTDRPDGVLVVNDAYNANPDSVRAALDAVAAMAVSGRRWAVLGGMLELGDEAQAEHHGVGRYAAELGFDELVAVGEGAREVAAAFPGAHWVPDTDAAHDLLAPALSAGDVVLLKSSRDSGLRWLGDRLAARGGGDAMKGVLLAASFSLVISLFGTPLFIKFLVKRGYGQFIRDDGPTSHHTKRGTPTMGGAVILAATLGAYFLAHLFTLNPPTASGLLVLFLMAGLGFVGFLDDFIKITKQRSLGLRSREKLIGQTLVGVIFAGLALQFPNEQYRTPASLLVSFVRDTNISLALGGSTVVGVILFVIFANVMIAGASNGVNLTDGLDGLATGVCTMVFGAFVLISIWTFNQNCQTNPGIKCYEVRDSHDLALVAAAGMGACFGFLWWNATPAKIFMGDTGSLALGGALAGLAITTHTEMLLIILGGMFVARDAVGGRPGGVVQDDR